MHQDLTRVHSCLQAVVTNSLAPQLAASALSACSRAALMHDELRFASRAVALQAAAVSRLMRGVAAAVEEAREGGSVSWGGSTAGGEISYLTSFPPWIRMCSAFYRVIGIRAG